MADLCMNGAANPQTQPTGCRVDILHVLRAAGHRLTTNRVLDALEAAGMIHGESTVKMALAEMVRCGVLDKDNSAEPRGYGLATPTAAQAATEPVDRAAPPPLPAPAPAARVPSLDAVLKLLDKPQPLDLALTAGGWRLTLRLAPTPEPATLAANRPPPQPTSCRIDILTVLRQAGHRMTTNQVLDALERENMLHGETTVKLALAEMVREGLLTNDLRTNPKGYALA